MAKEANLVEDLGYGARRYKLSEPHANYEYAIVVTLDLPEGRLVTHVYGAEADGPAAADGTTGFVVVLKELIGHFSDQDALGELGYKVAG